MKEYEEDEYHDNQQKKQRNLQGQKDSIEDEIISARMEKSICKQTKLEIEKYMSKEAPTDDEQDASSKPDRSEHERIQDKSQSREKQIECLEEKIQQLGRYIDGLLKGLDNIQEDFKKEEDESLKIRTNLTITRKRLDDERRFENKREGTLEELRRRRT